MRLKLKLRHRDATAPAPAHRVTIAPESHRGQHGVTVFEDGVRVAWGPTETAALAAYQVARAA